MGMGQGLGYAPQLRNKSNMGRALDMKQEMQSFDIDRQSKFMPGELDRQKIDNGMATSNLNRSNFELDRSKGFLPHELRKAELSNDGLKIGNDTAAFGLDRSRQLLPSELDNASLRNNGLRIGNRAADQSLQDQQNMSQQRHYMNQYDLQDRAFDMQDRGNSLRDWSDNKYKQGMRQGLSGGGRVGSSSRECPPGESIGPTGRCEKDGTMHMMHLEQMKDPVYAAKHKQLTDKINGDRMNQAIAELDRQLGIAPKNPAQPAPMPYSGNANNQQIPGANGRGRAPDNNSPVPVVTPPTANPPPNTYRPTNVPQFADGGTVPVRVSNGEFEFTPEQVTNIGAARMAMESGGLRA